MAGDDGFERFFEDHYHRVVRVLAVGWGDPGAAEDAAQEAFARALVRWRKVAAMDRPDGWVFVTATNVLRSRSRRQPLLQEAAVPVTVDHADAVTAQVTLAEALGALPPRQRQAVVLRHLAQLSTSEAARAMGCAPGTVKASLHGAMRNLSIELEDDDEDR